MTANADDGGGFDGLAEAAALVLNEHHNPAYWAAVTEAMRLVHARTRAMQESEDARTERLRRAIAIAERLTRELAELLDRRRAAAERLEAQIDGARHAVRRQPSSGMIPEPPARSVREAR